MKKLICFLFLSFSMGYAQDFQATESEVTTVVPEKFTACTLLKNEDFKLTNGRMIVNSRDCQIKNESTAGKVLISVVCQQNAFKQIGVEKINEMILFADGKARNTLTDSQNYNPTEIKMAYNPESKDWSLTNLFTIAENGVVTTKLLTLDFDASGRFVVMKRVL